MLLARGADVDGEKEGGDTAVMFAAGHDDLEIVKRLVAAGADVKRINRDGRDALDFASRGASSEVLDWLLPQYTKSRQDKIKRQARLVSEPQRAVDKQQCPRKMAWQTASATKPATPLNHALQRGASEQFLKLLSGECDPNKVNEYRTTLLALVGGSWSGADLVEPLIKAGANPNRPSRFFPLSMAAANGSKSVVRQLAAAGADVHARCEDRGTALMSAAASGNIDVAQLLLEWGSDPNAEDSQGRTAYRQAIESNNRDIAELLKPLTVAAEAAPWRLNRKGLSPERRLPAAADGGDVEYVGRLLAEGVPVDISDYTGSSPFHCAAARGHLEAVNALLDAGAPLEAWGCADRTPLLAAIGAT